MNIINSNGPKIDPCGRGTSPRTISVKFSVVSLDGQGTKRQRNIAENFNRLSRAHQRYRQTDTRQTDGTAIAYSEREREFTFAKNRQHLAKLEAKIYSATFSGHGVVTRKL